MEVGPPWGENGEELGLDLNEGRRGHDERNLGDA